MFDIFPFVRFCSPSTANRSISCLMEVISLVRLFHDFAWLQPLPHFHYAFWWLWNAPSSGFNQLAEHSCPSTRVTRIHLFRKRVSTINSIPWRSFNFITLSEQMLFASMNYGFSLGFCWFDLSAMLKSSILHNKCSRNKWMAENFRPSSVQLHISGMCFDWRSPFFMII